MASMEDSPTESIHPLITNRSSIVKYPEPRHEGASTALTVRFDLDSPISSIPPLKAIDDDANHQRRPSRKSSVKAVPMTMIQRQFSIRKIVQNRLRLLSDMMCLFGLLGVILMIAENEINFLNNNNRDTDVSWMLKWVISLSTVVLVGLVLFYHYSSLKLSATENSLEYWRVSLTIKRIFLILFEILICSVHPMPRTFSPNWLSKYKGIQSNVTISNSLIPSPVHPSYIATDVALGLPMFARLYLIGRCIMFHSHLVRDSPSKSFGALNQISINFAFLIKTYLAQWPTRCLMVFCGMMFLIGSWSIRACDYKPAGDKHISIFDAMWLFIVTFTTVGYGDLTPSTYCGRTIAAMIGLFGLLSSALLISVVTQKLALTRLEKYVHNFVSEVELRRERRKHAANVIKFAVKVWYYKQKNVQRRSLQHLKAQRSLYNSIQCHRQVKQEQRKSNDSCVDLIDSVNIQRYTSTKTKTIARDLATMQSTIENIEEKFTDVHKTMQQMQKTLDLLLDKNGK